MLYDWAEYTVNIGGKTVKVYIHLTELGFSRYKVLDATLTIKMGDVFDVLENAFSITGGLTQRIQVDNARIFVKEPSVKVTLLFFLFFTFSVLCNYKLLHVKC